MIHQVGKKYITKKQNTCIECRFLSNSSLIGVFPFLEFIIDLKNRIQWFPQSHYINQLRHGTSS